jgi:hypothetical protein
MQLNAGPLDRSEKATVWNIRRTEGDNSRTRDSTRRNLVRH